MTRPSVALKARGGLFPSFYLVFVLWVVLPIVDEGGRKLVGLAALKRGEESPDDRPAAGVADHEHFGTAAAIAAGLAERAKTGGRNDDRRLAGGHRGDLLGG